jgi:enoyl-CoA hydratase
VGIARAKELFFTGQVIDAARASEIGLISFCGDGKELDEFLTLLLEHIRACSPVAVSQMKSLVNSSPDISLQQSCCAEAVASCICVSSGDTKARVRAFLDRRRQKRER